MEVTQCDAPQRSTLATCIGVQADACGHGKLGGLLSGTTKSGKMDAPVVGEGGPIEMEATQMSSNWMT